MQRDPGVTAAAAAEIEGSVEEGYEVERETLMQVLTVSMGLATWKLERMEL